MGLRLRIVAWFAFAAWGLLLFLFDPETHDGFFSCPFHWLTGLFCPGCGAQRAVHDLLHARVAEAFSHNAALVAAIPLLGLQWAWARRRDMRPGEDNRLVWAWGTGLMCWWVLRNLPGMEALAP